MNEELIERFAAIVEPMQKLDLGLTALSGILHGKLAGGQDTNFELSILKSVSTARDNIVSSLKELLIYEVDKDSINGIIDRLNNNARRFLNE